MTTISSERSLLTASYERSSDKEGSIPLLSQNSYENVLGPRWFSLATFKTIFRIFWPIYMTVFLQGAMNFVSVAFTGHLGDVELAAVGLSCSLINITALGIGAGLATASDIIGAQMYGARKFKKVGILLQKSFMILLLTCFPIFAVWVNIDSILIAFKQPVLVAKDTQLYLLIYIPGVCGLFVYRALRSYVQVQGLVTPPIFTCTICFVLLIMLNYFLIYAAGLGLVGSAIAASLSMCCMPVFLGAYLFFRNVYVKTWPGFSSQSLLDWATYMKIGCFTLVAVMLKISTGEVAIILMGILGKAQLGAQALLFQVETVLVLMPLSMGFSMNILIGQELGAGRPQNARRIAKLGACLGLIVSVVFLLLVISLKDFIGLIFTGNEDVLKITRKATPIMGVMLFFDGMSYILDCIMRGLGRPQISAVVAFVGSYVVGLPLGVVLAFREGLGVVGMWIGLACGFSLQVVMFAVALLCWLDFEAESVKARERVSAKPKEKQRYGTTNSTSSTEATRGSAQTSFLELDEGEGEHKDEIESQRVKGRSQSESKGIHVTWASGSGEPTFMIQKGRTNNVTRTVVYKRVALLILGIVVLIIGIIIRVETGV